MIKLKDILFESPEYVRTINGKMLFSQNPDARSFGYDKQGNLHIGKYGEIHKDLKKEYGKMHYEGRFWDKFKIISFWDYPSPKDFKKIIKDIEKETGLRIWDDKKWMVDSKEKKNAHNLYYNLIPIKSYGGGIGFDRTSHEKTPIEKGKKKVPKGWGSRKISKDVKPGETMAQYHARQRTSEEQIKLKSLLIMIETNFTPTIFDYFSLI